jgi:hypothetical protein
MRFENWPVLGRKVPEYFSNAAVLTRFGQFKRPIDCRCHESRRYHGPAAETNGSCRAKADIVDAACFALRFVIGGLP